MVKQLVQNGKAAISENVSIAAIARSVLVSYIITIPVFIIFAFILTYTNFPEKYMVAVVIVTTIFSVLIAGSTATRGSKSKGWLNGGIVGLVYMVVLYITGSIALGNYKIDRYVLIMLVIGVLTGCIGGIFGINIRPSPHSGARRRSFK